MPEVTDELKNWSTSSGPTTSEERFLIDIFVADSIREHDAGQLPVDAEWLESLGFEFDKYKHVLEVDGDYEHTLEYFPHDDSLYFDGSFVCENPIRKHVTNLLEIVGGGE